jgi:hypothetical protein
MSKKVQRALHGPSWTEVILGAVLSLVLGVVIGAVLLIVRPVVVKKEMPKDAEREAGAVYYLEGSRDTSKARQAAAKRKAFAEGQSVTVTEEEINSLITPTATPAAAAAPKAGAKKENVAEKAKEKAAAATNEMLATGTPNFRIRNGEMQVGVPVTIGVAGVDTQVVVQAKGKSFTKNGDVFVFEPDELYLGSCPLHRIPFAAGFVRTKFLSSQPIPDDIAAAWKKLSSVTIEGNALKLTM